MSLSPDLVLLRPVFSWMTRLPLPSKRTMTQGYSTCLLQRTGTLLGIGSVCLQYDDTTVYT